jgi:hypothetical protein
MFPTFNETVKGKGFDGVETDEQYANEKLLDIPEIASGRLY